MTATPKSVVWPSDKLCFKRKPLVAINIVWLQCNKVITILENKNYFYLINNLYSYKSFSSEEKGD